MDADGPGYEKSLTIADEMISAVPTFDCFKGVEPGKLTVKGLEMHYLGLDARARAIYLRGKALVDAKDHDWEKASAAIEPSIADVDKYGAMFDDTMKQWVVQDEKDPFGAEKAKVADLAKAIDRTRREIVMVGFKLRVRQGNPTEANKMLDLLVKAGGSIEENQTTFEFMARDLAAQIGLLKKSGQVAEAKAMGEGLAILVKKLSEIPNQGSASILFLGQTLYLVEQYEDALKEFEKIPVPVIPAQSTPNATNPPKNPEWWNVESWLKLTDQVVEDLKRDVCRHTDQTLTNLRQARVSEAALDKLKSLKDKELTREEFDSEIKRLLTADEAKQFQEIILNQVSEKLTDTVLEKLKPMKNKLLPREDFMAELKKLLTPDENKRFQDVILKRAPNKLDNNQDKKTFQEQVKNYRPAQLFTARCLHALNRLPDAEKLLTTAIGTPDKQGYGFSSLEFREDLARVYEAKGAATADPKLANAEWKKAIGEWTTLFSFARNEVSKLKEGDLKEKEKQVKSRYFEIYLEYQRCLIEANTQLLKGNPKLSEKIGEIGKKISESEIAGKFTELEKKGAGILTTEVWSRYCDLLDKYPGFEETPTRPPAVNSFWNGRKSE